MGVVLPVGVTHDERQHEGGRDGLRPVDVGEDHRVAEDLTVEGEDLSLRGEWRLFGQQDVRREEPGPDLGVTARVERFLVVGGLDPLVVALGKAFVVDVAVAVDRQGDAQQFRRFSGSQMVDVGVDRDRDRDLFAAGKLLRRDAAVERDPHVRFLCDLSLGEPRRQCGQGQRRHDGGCLLASELVQR